MLVINKIVNLIFLSAVINSGNFKCSGQCISANNSRSVESRRGDYRSALDKLPGVFKFKVQDSISQVNLHFSVPFFKVPVKGATDTAGKFFRGIRKANNAVLVLSGVTVLFGLGIAFFLTSLEPFSLSKTIEKLNNINSFKGLENDIAGASYEHMILYFLQNQEHINSGSCLKNIACQLVKQSMVKVSKGQGSNVSKLIDGLTSNRWLMSFLSGTVISKAIAVGRSRTDCNQHYNLCRGLDAYFTQVINKI
ncbi:unnamed protein product [Hermetia illucens]|uniref:Uncharacterized protein n=1 Tax=Hermetia illucens TaxID=343691 RepID=A0A7R8V0X6_HERIL|nr:uncharacterized protein LOC119657024 [Hermetia illucens]CAD7090209.1 unnamed protein product [Hermetia illucens]